MPKKLIIRADDVGYTKINNVGAFETFEHGIATAADVMLDTPGSVDALERLRDFPWISVGWHTHFWGSPLLPYAKVASLVDRNTGHFRSDIGRTSEIDKDELLAEMRAQIELCISILGHAPETAEIAMGKGTVFGAAKEQICREYGIITGFDTRVRQTPEGDGFTYSWADEKYLDKKIIWMDPGPAYKALFSDSIEAHLDYDPIKYYTEDHGKTHLLPEDCITGQAWHPGYVDYYMCRCGDKGPNARKFIECRPIDTYALCSDELKDWVRRNGIELMSFRDAIYGTRDYQNHLRNIGSDLCVL